MERKVYNPRQSDIDQRECILREFVERIKATIPSDGYALNGGYILESILNSCSATRDTRYTTDIDLSLSCEEYQELLIGAIVPYLDELKTKGIIYSYSIERLGISKNCLPTSGRVVLYKKDGPNIRKRVFCGIDFDLHPLFYGLIRFTDGTTAYSLSRSIGDKFIALYLSDEKKLLHRSKDIIDLYLIDQFLSETKREINFSITLRSIKEDLVNVYNIRELPIRSNLELLLIKRPESVYDEIKHTLKTIRINEDMLRYSSIEDIITVSITFINTIRSKYYELYR